MSLSLTTDEVECVGILRDNSVDAVKLRKLVDSSVGEAGAVIKEYNSTKLLPTAMAKALLGGVFSATVAHTNDAAERTAQVESLKKLVNDPNMPSYLKGDGSLGKGNGLNARLALVERLQAKAERNLVEVKEVLHKRGPDILENVAVAIKETGAEYADLFEDLDKAVMAKMGALIQSMTPLDGGAKQGQPPSKQYPDLKDPKDPLYLVALLADAQEGKRTLDEFIRHLVDGVAGAEPKYAPLKSVGRSMVKVYEKYACLFDQVGDSALPRPFFNSLYNVSLLLDCLVAFPQLTDLARATVLCKDERVLCMILEKLSKAAKDKAVFIVRIKHRLSDEFDATEAG